MSEQRPEPDQLLCSTPVSNFQKMSTSESEPCGTPITPGQPCPRCGRTKPADKGIRYWTGDWREIL